MLKKFLMSAAAAMLMSAAFGQSVVKSGDKISFLGGSITAYGRFWSGGFTFLVQSGLRANGINATTLYAGAYGQMVDKMLERMDRDVLAKKPQFMVLCCGMTEVRLGKRGIPADKFKEYVTAVVDKAQAQGIKVCIMTDTILYEDLKMRYPAFLNKELAARYDMLRTLAKEKNCLFADPYTDFRKTIDEYKKKYPGIKGNLLTEDGIHQNAIGDWIIACDLLRAFGLNDEQIATAEAAWKKENRRSQIPAVTLSAAELEAVMKKAAEKNLSVTDYIASVVEKETAAQ